jgi:tetratricopeptide (TPR) repeat protein
MRDTTTDSAGATDGFSGTALALKRAERFVMVRRGRMVGGRAAFERAIGVQHVLICAVTVALSLPARAEGVDDAAYDREINAALQAFEQERFAEARNHFEQAHARQPSARTLRGLGIASVALRRYDLALRELEAALEDSRRPLTAAQQTEVSELVAWIRTSLPRLRLQLAPAHARALVDDVEVTAPEVLLDPGVHRLQVSAPGHQPHADAFELADTEQATLRVTLLPLSTSAAERTGAAPAQPTGATRLTHAAAPQRDSPALYERWWFWTAVGVVVAGGVAATVALTARADPEYEPSDFGVITIR